MIIKLIIFICIAYLAYRLIVGPPLLGEGKSDRNLRQEEDDDDFTDYEEIK